MTTGVDEEITQLHQALDFQPSDIENTDTEQLIDLYGLAARAKSRFEDRRKAVRDELLERAEEEGTLDCEYASVSKRTQTRRSVKSEATVFERTTYEQVRLDDVSL